MSPAIVHAERLIRPRKGLVSLDFAELWRYRELFWFLAWRDVLVKYKQTYLGIAWAVIQPLLTVLIFALVFGRVGKFPSNDAPYVVLVFAALLPWQFFANALGDSSNSLVASAHMISKVYFPRLIIPTSAVLGGIIDFCISLIILFIMMACYGVHSPRIFSCFPFSSASPWSRPFPPGSG